MTTNGDTRSSNPYEPPVDFEHITVKNEDTPDECVIVPRRASEKQLTTAWIVALEGSFVDLGTMR